MPLKVITKTQDGKKVKEVVIVPDKEFAMSSRYVDPKLMAREVDHHMLQVQSALLPRGPRYAKGNPR